MKITIHVLKLIIHDVTHDHGPSTFQKRLIRQNMNI